MEYEAAAESYGKDSRSRATERKIKQKLESIRLRQIYEINIYPANNIPKRPKPEAEAVHAVQR